MKPICCESLACPCSAMDSWESNMEAKNRGRIRGTGGREGGSQEVAAHTLRRNEGKGCVCEEG